LENTEIPAVLVGGHSAGTGSAAIHGDDTSSSENQQQGWYNATYARDEYRRRIEQAVAHVASLMVNNFPEVDDVPSDADILTLEQRQAAVKRKCCKPRVKWQTIWRC
jgi:hypothetical protein